MVVGEDVGLPVAWSGQLVDPAGHGELVRARNLRNAVYASPCNRPLIVHISI